jgi:hypothetical protein
LTIALSTVVVAAGCGVESAAIGQTTTQQATSSHSEGTAAGAATASSAASATAGGASSQTASAAAAQSVSYDAEDEDATWSTSGASQVTLAGDSISYAGTGATVDGSTITITSAGVYVITGTLNDGQIVVDSAGDGTVRLVLNGVGIVCSDSAAIYVKNAGRTIITLADGSENSVSDGSSYALEDPESDEPDAVVFSNDDLTINGSGSLTVDANHNDGIASKDDLKITGGTITVDAVNDALQGKDCVGVQAGTITITSGGDGLKATNDQDATKGHVAIAGGSFVIDSGTDAIQAQTTLLITGGDFAITTGGGSVNSSQNVGQAGNTWGAWGRDAADNGATTGTTDAASAKALKAGTGIFVTDGTFAVDSSDDSLNSNGNVTIDGGVFQLTSGDDGVHADDTLAVNGGELTITQSYEGLEASVIAINGGTIHVTAADDAINVAGGMDSSSTSGRPGQNDFAANPDNMLTISGGYLCVNAGGDGLDSNGTATLSGGLVIVDGPTQNGNGSLDAQTFTITGGFLVTAGSSGMAEAPSDTSSQYSLMVNFDQVQAAGTIVHIESKDGDSVLTFAPAKQFQSVVFSSAELKKGATYRVYLGGSATGTITDGIYSDGAYTPGTEYAALSLDSTVTTFGATGGFGGAGMVPGR